MPMAEFKSFDEFQKELHHGADPAPVLPEPAEERAEKKKFHIRKPSFHFGKFHSLKMYALGAAGVIVLAAGALFFLPISFGQIRLHGNEAVTMEDVLFDGAITGPVNVLQISTGDLAARLGKDIRIASARAERSFPFYIDVTIEERKPLAVVQEEFGYAFLDKEGMVIQTAPSIRGVDLPIVTGIKLDNVLLGDRTMGSRMEGALAFMGSLSESGRHQFSEINVGNPEQVTAYTRGGLAVRLGDGSQMEERARLAENMVNDVKARNLSVYYIDASLTSPYIKLKK